LHHPALATMDGGSCAQGRSAIFSIWIDRTSGRILEKQSLLGFFAQTGWMARDGLFLQAGCR
jgi:hypothetical protein